MQAYFELLHIPQTFAIITKQHNVQQTWFIIRFKPYGIKNRYIYYLNKGDVINTDEIAKVGLPCFVKPNKAVLVSNFQENCCRIANRNRSRQRRQWNHHRKFPDGTEVSVEWSIIKEQCTVLPITEIVSDNDFSIMKPNIWVNLKKSHRQESQMKWHKSEHSQTRLRSTQNERFLEANLYCKRRTTHAWNEYHSGLTTESLIPQQAKAAGISLEDLFFNAIELAFK
jgi:D-alanine-D-alanine ligase